MNGIGGMGFSSFVFQQAAMVGIDHRRLILGLLRAAARPGRRDGRGLPVARRTAVPPDPRGARGADQRAPGQPAEWMLRRSVPAGPGYDVRFFLMDLQSRYTEIGLFYVLHHDVEEIQALVGDPVRRATIEAVGAAVRADFAIG